SAASLSRSIRQKFAGEMRGAGHDVRDGLEIVFVAGPPGVEEGVEPAHPIRVAADGLQAQRYPVIGEGDLHLTQPQRAAEISRRIDPQPVERLVRPLRLNLRPRLVWKEMSQPEHHAEPEILIDLQA